eukprot:1225829-Pleurochrysis_carterae.AAC.1
MSKPIFDSHPAQVFVKRHQFPLPHMAGGNPVTDCSRSPFPTLRHCSMPPSPGSFNHCRLGVLMRHGLQNPAVEQFDESVTTSTANGRGYLTANRKHGQPQSF